MEPVSAAIMGGGSLLGGVVSALGAHSANEMAAGEAQKNRAFQEQMSNTAYQRATADMKKAGINPMLAYMKGGADSAPGSMASVTNPAGELGESIGTSARQVTMEKQAFEKSLEQQDSQIALNKASALATTAGAAANLTKEKLWKPAGDVVDWITNKIKGVKQDYGTSAKDIQRKDGDKAPTGAKSAY